MSNLDVFVRPFTWTNIKLIYLHTDKKKEDEVYMVVVGRIMSQDSIQEVGLLPEEASTETWVTQTSLDGKILHVSQK